MHPGSADVILCGDRVGIPACIPRLRHPFPQVHRIRGHGTSRDRGTTAAVLRTRGKRSSSGARARSASYPLPAHVARDSLCRRQERASMSEHFLEEQLKRIREMTERMARLQARAAELPEEFERDRATARQGPLEEARELRTYAPMRATAD